jgi:hypothetical protein
VNLTRNRDTAFATPDTLAAVANGLFCVAANTPLQFQTAGNGKTFQVVFSNGIPPAPNAQSPMKGTTAMPVSINASNAGCFKYSIQVCDFDGGPCGYSDPKIIIGDTGLAPYSQNH